MSSSAGPHSNDQPESQAQPELSKEQLQKAADEAAQKNPVIPKTAKEASLMGLEPAEGVSFADQVKGNAKFFAGKVTGNDEEVKLGAAKLRGEI